jgi:cytoskeleton protein RodZ
MPDIGATLREARMRARIDVSEVEAQTKIRAKYLRALENEEWDLLPGPTYVKSFLRTYAEALDLDAKLLVDEYKLRHERLSDVELQPINAAAPGRERRKSGPSIPPGVFVVLIIAALIVALYLLGSGANSPAPTDNGATTAPTTTAGQATTPAPAVAPPPAPAPATVRLQIIGTGQGVNVCLKAGDRTLVNGATLGKGDKTANFRSKRFRLTLGNANAILRINGRNRTVKPSADAIGLQITPTAGRRPLSAAKRPVCQ